MQSQKLKTIIVDDEPAARLQIQALLEKISSIEVLAMAASVDEAVPLIIQFQPDLLFLDVEMPGKTGFDLVGEMRRLEIYPQVVFVTGHQVYAIQALRIAALDYILKPIDPQELTHAVNRALSCKFNHKLPQKIDQLLQQLSKQKRIRFNIRSGFILVDPFDIIYIQADWNYSEFFLKNDKHELVTINIGKLEEILPAESFARINRSTIINLDFLISVDRIKRKCLVDMQGQQKKFCISRTRLRELEKSVY